jgi:hypothetical protein
MKEVRAFKLEKYMEISIDGSLVKDKIIFNNIYDEYALGIDLSIEANIFYGINTISNLYEMVLNSKEFDNYNAIFRLLNWSKEKNKEKYNLRCLKSNKNEKVDFKEEKEYLNSFVDITKYLDKKEIIFKNL